MTEQPRVTALVIPAVCWICAGLWMQPQSLAADAPRPNILWLSVEDISPHLGCYGDAEARTPNLDRFAREGLVYENAFVVAPVCAPCRSSIITGVYPTTLGSHHMRSRIRLPEPIKCFPEYLRAAGYYCTNNVKTDYQFEPPASAWDESTGRAHWKNRPRADQPFFAVFNFGGTHESRVRGDEPAYSNTVRSLQPGGLHDPAKLTLPPYYPDTSLVREDWSRYYNCITAMDKWFTARLEELEEAGLGDDTIVFFWSDHGVGLPRGKRWLYDSGLRVPLVVRIPEKFRRAGQGTPGARKDELVVLMDLGPTVLNLCGVEAPDHMQGRAFLGDNLTPQREYVFAARDRMDERYEMQRAVRDKRFKYIRNYEPWKPYAQPVRYGEVAATMQELRRLHSEDALSDAAAAFLAATKPVEELYDTQNDPHELDNLADDPAFAEVLERMRQKHMEWVSETRDLGFLPESLLEVEGNAAGTRYDVLHQEDSDRRLRSIVDVAWQAGDSFAALQTGVSPSIDGNASQHSDPAVRYWYTHWIGQHIGRSAELTAQVEAALKDPDGAVRAAAARWLAAAGDSAPAVTQLGKDLTDENWWVRLHAANVLDSLGEDARPVLEEIRRVHEEAVRAGDNPFAADFVGSATQMILDRLETP